MLRLQPMSLKAAHAFVAQHHRHHKPVVGHKFSISCVDGNGTLHGVAIEILTVDDLAGLLKISKPVAYDLANRDDFPSFKIGKSIRIYQSGLVDWLSRQTADRKG